MPAHRRHAAAILTATVAILLLALPGSATAADKNQLDERSTTTYRVLPDEKVLRTTIDVSLVARRKPTYRVGPCKGDRSRRCRIRTNYYWDHWTEIYVPVEATDLRFSGRGVKGRPVRETGDGTGYEVTFPRLDFKKKQTFSITYDLPAGERETNTPTRIGESYAHFCWYGPFADRGSVRAILPPGWESISYGSQPNVTSSATATTLRSPGKKDPGAFFACTEAFAPAAAVRAYVLSPGGSLVTVDGWLDDPLWTSLMVDELEYTLPLLERLIGSPLPLGEVVIREASTQALRWSGGDLAPRDGVIRISEDITSPGLPTNRLARAWFDESAIADAWLREGLSLWSAFGILEMGCPEPVTSPGAGLPSLGEWMTPERAGAAYDQALANDQAAAACGIVEEIAMAIGPERMSDVIGTLLAGPEPADWRDWLDAVEGQGLMLAGVEDMGMAQQQLLDHGVATAAELSGRTSAWQLYTEALIEMTGTRMPGYVDEFMAAWQFPEALMAIVESSRTYRAIADHPTMADADQATYLAAFEAADSPAALASLASPCGPSRRPDPTESAVSG